MPRGDETFAASRRWRMTNAPRQISPDFPPTLIRDLIAILVGCCHRRSPAAPAPPPLPTGGAAPAASNTVKTPHLATGNHIKAASTRRKTSGGGGGGGGSGCHGNLWLLFPEWPRASISLLGWELITCINHRRRSFRQHLLGRVQMAGAGFVFHLLRREKWISLCGILCIIQYIYTLSFG